MKKDLKNVTVTMEEHVARWARVRAAEREVSLAQFLGGLLKERMHQEASYETAMLRYLSRAPRELRRQEDTYPDREELH